MLNKINILCGTTASGKTKYAVELAKRINGVIINCDSMQVYEEIPILSAQPNEDEKQGVEHLLYSCISCFDEFNVAKWLALATNVINGVLKEGKTPILVGGTGLYVKTLTQGISNLPEISPQTKDYITSISEAKQTTELFDILANLDPLIVNRIKPGDRQRILRALSIFKETSQSIITLQQTTSKTQNYDPEAFYLMLLNRNRVQVYENINKRFHEMIQSGVIEEVKAIYKKAENFALPKAHGLPELIKYLDGKLFLEEAINLAQQNTRNYAKRQTTWFKHQLNFDQIIEL